MLSNAFRREEKISNTELAAIHNKIQELEQKLTELPEGKFYCKNNGGNAQWYLSIGGKSEYIPKSKRVLAEKLAQKMYLEKQISLLKIQEYRITKLIQVESQIEKLKKEYFIKKIGFNNLLKSMHESSENDFWEWANADFTGNKYNEEAKKYETMDGHMVRSKSESMIADALFENGIPYRYENPLELFGKVYYPDFTTIRMSDGEKFCWEHFGMMDNGVYREKMLEKMNVYVNNGYIPGINLITSYETKENPLTSAKIQKLINTYLK